MTSSAGNVNSGRATSESFQPSQSAPVGVAVVGAGYWGPNLIRNFSACPATRLVAVCDKDQARLRKALASYPAVEPIDNMDTLLARDDVGAVAIATPPQTHAALGKAALLAGKHVLFEKPLATSVAEATELVDLAASRGLTIMVDHTFIYSPAIRKIKHLIDSGELGEIYYIDSVRINLGLFQNDVNVLWDLAVHDLAIVDYLLGRLPQALSAFGRSHTSSGMEDVAYLNLDFGNRLLASFHVNWLSPVKIRHLIVGGSKKGLVYNDLDQSEPIKVYDRGITISQDAEARRGALIGYRIGDVWSPHLEREEPLQNMVRHFADCIKQGTAPLTDGQAGLRVVRILDLAQRSIKAHGNRLMLANAPVGVGLAA